MIRDYNAPVVIKEKVCDGVYRLEFYCPEIARSAKPGQFVLVQTGKGGTPLLLRPLGVLSVSEKSGTFSILFRNVGSGTALLCEVGPGDTLHLRGPAGNSFSMPKNKRCWAVAGTLGIVPLMFFRNCIGSFEKFLLGVPGGPVWRYFTDWVAGKIPELEIYSDDGSLGHKGFSIDGLRGQNFGSLSLAACGPNPMLMALFQNYGSECNDIQVSLEKRMACGMGGCHGCVVDTVSGRLRVCVDGPVFQAKEVLWDGMHQ